MKQHFTDERTGIRYTLQGDYYLPDLQLPPEKETEIGLWGQRHLRYLNTIIKQITDMSYRYQHPSDIYKSRKTA